MTERPHRAKYKPLGLGLFASCAMRIRPETLVWVNARERSDHEMGDCRRVSHAGPVWTITNRGNILLYLF